MKKPNGYLYKGDWANNLKNGYGRLTHEDGIKYEGEFVDGFKQG